MTQPTIVELIQPAPTTIEVFEQVSQTEVGAFGPQGPEGPPSQVPGPRGEVGPPGPGLQLKGTLASTAALPSDGTQEPGDGYLVGGNLHTWDGFTWVNVGQVQGPKGDKGDPGTDGAPGADGPDAYETVVLRNGFTGTSVDWEASLQGANGTDGQDGQSTYEAWLTLPGNAGKTLEQFVAAQRGEKGDKGEAGTLVDVAGITFSIVNLTADAWPARSIAAPSALPDSQVLWTGLATNRPLEGGEGMGVNDLFIQVPVL